MHRIGLGILAVNLLAQAPATDRRNTYVPTTDTHFQMPEYRTLAEWEARRAHLRKQILFAAGLLPLPEKTPLRPQVFGRIEREDYSVEKVYLETLPGYFLGGNLYRPLRRTGKLPAVANPHGHWNYGRLEHQPLGSVPARAVQQARMGYVAFTYDMVGYNDTVQTPHAFGGAAEQLWSFGPLGLQLWNSIRVIDFLESLPEVDPARIAVTGASGGGTQTFLLSAVDDRVSFAAPVNMVSAIMQGGSPCENAPGLRRETFNVEIAAMTAPRPMQLVAATGDWTRNVPREEFPAIRRIYELYGKPENVDAVQFDAPHNYNKESREAVYGFFARRLSPPGDPPSTAERGFRIERLPDMLVLHGRALPSNALAYDDLFRQWKQAAASQSDSTRDAAALRERLLLALGAQWPASVRHQESGGAIVLGREGSGDRVPGLWQEGRGTPALVVHPGGAQAARSTPQFQALAKAGRPVLAIDAFQTGAAAAPRDRSHRHFLAFNVTDDAARVQDILTALAFLRSRSSQPVELVGLEKAAVWTLFAAAVAPVEVKLSSDWSGFRGTDAEFQRDLFVPGIQRAGGLAAAVRLVGGR